jgi:protein-L-isoaspartate(D-aspartate) O-methyltransferase
VRPWRKSPPSDDPREQLLARLRPHVSDARVLEAIRAVPRDQFVPARRAAEAWDNVALPIGSGQTISQPLVVARMCELLELSSEDRVLDVGTGSGYHAAVLARLVRHVWTVERHPGLSDRAGASLAAAGVENVTLLVGDGTLGHPACAPYDAINVAAAMGRLPEALAGQLAPGGRLVGPVDDGDQRLIRLRRTAGGELERSAHERVRFVPLISPPLGR